MRRRLILLVAAVFLLSACEVLQGGEMQDTPTAPQKNESLTVFCIGDLRDSDMIRRALSLYEKQYPEVSVELLKPEYDVGDYEAAVELYQRVAAQIMAGEGPDVFIVDASVMDVEKLVRQGIFADMEPFFQADDFDWEPYQKTVMDGGVWNGKRFVVPLTYDFPLLFTTRTALEETGFDMDACKDYQGFLEETTRFMEDPTQTRQLLCKPQLISDVPEISGISIADYDTKTVDLSSPVLQRGLRWYKTLMEKHPGSEATFGYNDLAYSASLVRDGQVLWTPCLLGAFEGFFNEFAALKTIDEAVMMPIRDLDGGIRAKIGYSVAVRGNSENLQNAYHYMEILLSPEVQHELHNGCYLSVLNSANEYGYQMVSQGKIWYVKPGTGGFVSTVDPYQGVDWPTEEEFQQFVGFTQEITGTYYATHLGLRGKMYPFVYENADFEKTLRDAQRQIEIYLTE